MVKENFSIFGDNKKKNSIKDDLFSNKSNQKSSNNKTEQELLEAKAINLAIESADLDKGFQKEKEKEIERKKKIKEILDLIPDENKTLIKKSKDFKIED